MVDQVVGAVGRVLMVLRVNGLRPRLAAGWVTSVLIGCGAVGAGAQAWVNPLMTLTDLSVSVGAMFSLVSTILVASLLSDPIRAYSMTAARSLWPSAVAARGVALLASSWPLIWVVFEVPMRVVAAVVALNWLCLGLSSLVTQVRRLLVMAPPILALALAMSAGLLPLTVHPFTPSQHPPAVVVIEAALGVGISLLPLERLRSLWGGR